MSDAILVRDWNVDDFHRHVLESRPVVTSPGGKLIASLQRQILRPAKSFIYT